MNLLTCVWEYVYVCACMRMSILACTVTYVFARASLSSRALVLDCVFVCVRVPLRLGVRWLPVRVLPVCVCVSPVRVH